MDWEVVSLSRHVRSRQLCQGILIVSILVASLSTASAQPGNPLGGTAETDGEQLICANSSHQIYARKKTICSHLIMIYSSDGIVIRRLSIKSSIHVVEHHVWNPLMVACMHAGSALQTLTVAFGNPPALASWQGSNPCGGTWAGITCALVNGAQRVTSL